MGYDILMTWVIIHVHEHMMFAHPPNKRTLWLQVHLINRPGHGKNPLKKKKASPDKMLHSFIHLFKIPRYLNPGGKAGYKFKHYYL